MISVLISGLYLIGSIVLFRRICETKKEKIAGTVLLCASAICLALYGFGILGVGLPSLIMNLLGKAGIST